MRHMQTTNVGLQGCAGFAGTGKSFLLNHIVNQLRGQYEEDFQDSVAICASTGIAATHIGGTKLYLPCGN